MFQWLGGTLEKSAYFMPHGHCYLWIPWLLWMHVISDFLIGAAYLGISIILWMLVRRIRLPFSPVILAFGLFIALCGGTHFLEIWNVWQTDYIAAGLLKSATAAASVATAIGLFYIRPQIEEVVHAARLSEERRIRLESTNAELEATFARVKELDELKSRFFANVSHELRTPLALIMGPAEQMLADDSLSSDQRRLVQSISANSRMLLTQVNDLLDLAKVESGNAELSYMEVDTADWLRGVASQFEFAAEQRGIRYRVSAPTQLMADIDPGKLERVLVNLLSNAFNFAPAGGTVTARLEDEGSDLRLEVSDSGPGVPPDQRETIFERFRQAEGDATRQHRGTGLGLAIVKEFTQLHRGRVEITDAADGGAAFTVTLPRRAPADVVIGENAAVEESDIALKAALHQLDVQQVAVETGSAATSIPGRPQVLLVEDNIEMQQFVSGVLLSRFNVSIASDGVEGLARAQALQPDLIITDLMMPRMSGDQLVDALRTIPSLDRVPVLLLTAKADQVLRVRLLEHGAQDYLLKPFLPQELLARAGNLIDAKLAGDVLRTGIAGLSTDLADLARQVVLRNRQLKTTLDAARVARRQAEQATRVKSYFLGMISHELRSPLSTMHLNLQMLARDKRTELPAPIKPKVERLARATSQMAGLVDGLLEYSRAKSGRLEATFQSVDAGRLIQEVIDEQADGVQSGVTLSYQPPGALVSALQSDPRLLRVVLSNLISNALKFTPQGSVTVRLSTSAQSHLIEVQDTGPGIPQADLGRVFEPFEQLEPLKRKTLPGVGLGLALVKNIVEALGGNVRIASAVGTGTTMSIELPSIQKSEPA